MTTDSTGLTADEHELLVSVFRKHNSLKEVILFGSRAKGNAGIRSDIDIAVKGLTSMLEVESLAMDLELLPLPYRFDVQGINFITNQQLLEHIARVGIVLYKKRTG